MTKSYSSLYKEKRDNKGKFVEFTVTLGEYFHFPRDLFGFDFYIFIPVRYFMEPNKKYFSLDKLRKIIENANN